MEYMNLQYGLFANITGKQFVGRVRCSKEEKFGMKLGFGNIFLKNNI